MRKVIAIDFDGCMCECAWPEIGAPHMEIINAAIQEKANGAALILWTCRVGKLLDEAVKFCEGLGLTFDAVNANLPERIAYYQRESRKVSVDEYWDDKAVIAEKCLVMGPAGEDFRRDRILRDAVRTWGQDAQTLMMIEEMSELTKAICKLYRATDDGSGSAAVENIREEMADVQIMLDQMKIMFGDTAEHERAKLNRLEKRLEASHAKEGGRNEPSAL